MPVHNKRRFAASQCRPTTKSACDNEGAIISRPTYRKPSSDQRTTNRRTRFQGNRLAKLGLRFRKLSRRQNQVNHKTQYRRDRPSARVSPASAPMGRCEVIERRSIRDAQGGYRTMVARRGGERSRVSSYKFAIVAPSGASSASRPSNTSRWRGRASGAALAAPAPRSAVWTNRPDRRCNSVRHSTPPAAWAG